MVIRQLHGIDSTWEKSVPVIEEFQGRTVWDGDVEGFKGNYPKTETAYAWSDADSNFKASRLPPIRAMLSSTDPRNAVKVSIVATAKKGGA